MKLLNAENSLENINNLWDIYALCMDDLWSMLSKEKLIFEDRAFVIAVITKKKVTNIETLVIGDDELEVMLIPINET